MSGPRHSRRRRFAEWWITVHWYFLGLLVVVTFAIGVMGFRQWYATHDLVSATGWDAVYESIQLFILESGAAEPPVPATLNLARFLGVLAFFYGATAAAFTIFREQVGRLRLKRARGHAVVCGLGDRGLYIAMQLLREGWRVAVIERDEEAPRLDWARAEGAVAVIGDATDPTVLRRARADRAAYVIAVCPEDGENAEIAVRLIELAGDAARRPVTMIAHIYDTELCTLLREQTSLARGSTGVRLNFFNVPENGARAMLDAVPPLPLRDGRAPHIVVVGIGKLGRSLVMTAAHDWLENRDPSTPRPRVTMIDHSAADKCELLRIRFPQIDEACELIPLTMPKNAPDFERGNYLHDAAGGLDVDAVYVCPDDDVHSLAAALTIQRQTRDSDLPIAVRMTREGGLASLLTVEPGSAFANLVPVGVLDHACDPKSLLA